MDPNILAKKPKKAEADQTGFGSLSPGATEYMLGVAMAGMMYIVSQYAAL